MLWSGGSRGQSLSLVRGLPAKRAGSSHFSFNHVSRGCGAGALGAGGWGALARAGWWQMVADGSSAPGCPGRERGAIDSRSREMSDGNGTGEAGAGRGAGVAWRRPRCGCCLALAEVRVLSGAGSAFAVHRNMSFFTELVGCFFFFLRMLQGFQRSDAM